ncbi:glycoside hydrolase family 104 protein [Acinetobacter sp. 243_ASPC]|uniref:glycoside hydrolase family 24 protein n=1 Tax=Acinetobacter sp. 243_ASPC TaxID=1579345 RepID=UPI00066135F5|nr:glycoside hydrolase family 104 protein [Acinetobacter sp. 243_ASPC]
MAKLSQLQEAYNNPNVRRFLNAIADAEGVKYGYNTLFGNQQFNDLSAHPNVRKAFKQTDGTTNYTTAAGRYQFIKDTWNGLANQYGFKDFSPQSQDLGAIALIAQNGALNDVMMGHYENAVNKLGSQWASLPSSKYAQAKRSWDQFNQYLGKSNTGNKNEYSPTMVDLKSVGIQSAQYQPEYVDLQNVGIGKQTRQYQPEMVDLKSVGIG